MQKRVYLDFNSTSPLSRNVIDYLESGDVSFCNPASQHSSGKKLRSHCDQAINDIKSHFSNTDHFDLYFHSGATEGITSFFHHASKGDLCLYSESDHEAVHQAIQQALTRGAKAKTFKINAQGDLDTNDLRTLIKDHPTKVYLNFTLVHNETGVIWPWDLLAQFKAEKIFIHVDAVQSIFKYKDWDTLSDQATMITYSSHKFGSLKGCGFSFIHNDFDFHPLIAGGAQQKQRGGTENPLALITTKIALADQGVDEQVANLESLKREVEAKLKSTHGDRVIILGENAKFGRNSNTICFALKDTKSDIALIKFDMAGFDVSSGSACSSGILNESKTIKAMGHSELSKNSIRISFDPRGYDDLSFKDKLFSVIEKL